MEEEEDGGKMEEEGRMEEEEDGGKMEEEEEDGGKMEEEGRMEEEEDGGKMEEEEEDGGGREWRRKRREERMEGGGKVGWLYSVYLDLLLPNAALKEWRASQRPDTRFVCVCGAVSPASPVAQGRPSLVLSAWLKSWPLRAAADSPALQPPHAPPCLHPSLEQCGASPANTHIHTSE